jgi:hypothetical protein
MSRSLIVIYARFSAAIWPVGLFMSTAVPRPSSLSSTCKFSPLCAAARYSANKEELQHVQANVQSIDVYSGRGVCLCDSFSLYCIDLKWRLRTGLISPPPPFSFWVFRMSHLYFARAARSTCSTFKQSFGPGFPSFSYPLREVVIFV